MITGEFEIAVANLQASQDQAQPLEQMMLEEDFKNLTAKNINKQKTP